LRHFHPSQKSVTQNNLVSPSRFLYWGNVSPCGPSKSLYSLLLVTVPWWNVASLLCRQQFYIIYFFSSIKPELIHHLSYSSLVVWLLNLSLYSSSLHTLKYTPLQFCTPIQDYGLASKDKKTACSVKQCRNEVPFIVFVIKIVK